jgi:hypothetical protein
MLSRQRSPERIEQDHAASEHRKRLIKALAYVAVYRKRGAIIPPEACEHCGAGQQLTRYSKVMKLHVWHPDLTKPREIAWLCTPCRNYARAAGEPVELHWQWPGMPIPPKGRPRNVAINPAWIQAAQAQSEKSKLSDLADQLFFLAFRKSAAMHARHIFAQAIRFVTRGKVWEPTLNPTIDARLRSWATFECRSTQNASETRIVEPRLPWQRRPRIDQELLLIQRDEPLYNKPFDEIEHKRKVTTALDKLSIAEAEFDAMIKRLGF